MAKRLLVTVGTTQFQQLTDLWQDKQFLAETSSVVDAVVVQVGNGSIRMEDFVVDASTLTPGSDIEAFWSQLHQVPHIPLKLGILRFTGVMQELMQSADMIISHCGAGTTMEALTLMKPLCLVSNPSLLRNHQSELGTALRDAGHAAFVDGAWLIERPPEFIDAVSCCDTRNMICGKLQGFLRNPVNGSDRFIAKMQTARLEFQKVLQQEAGCVFH